MVLTNLMLLNVLWFCSVLGAANQVLWPATVALLALLLVTFIYEDIKRKDLAISLFSLIFGTVVDGYLMYSGLVVYASKWHTFAFIPPIWILMLWLGFGASVKTGMQWLLNRPSMGAA